MRRRARRQYSAARTVFGLLYVTATASSSSMFSKSYVGPSFQEAQHGLHMSVCLVPFKIKRQTKYLDGCLRHV